MSLVGQLADDSGAWLGRSRKMVRSLRALGALSEPAAIPSIVRYLLADDQTVAGETAIVVENLYVRMSPELLPTLDERIRAESYWGFQSERWRTLAGNVVDRFRADPTHALALGLISCHASGYVRQAAVESLEREITSGAEIPFLLLRLDDWVPAVRQRAEQAVARRLTDSYRHAYFENLWLIARLGSRLRASASPALARIESLLRADAKALVGGALGSESRRARRFGVSLALEALTGSDLETAGAVLGQVIESGDPAARLQATCWLAKPTTTLHLQRQFLPRLLHDRSVAVRRVALGWCATKQPGSHVAILHGALLDESSMIRSIAQFHLPKLEEINLRSFYREAVSQSERPRLKAALGGLGETGVAADAELLLPLVDAPEPKIRKAALGALAKLALETHLEVFVNALQSGSPSVSRQARIALERHASIVGADRLAMIFAETPHPHVRRQTLALMDRLSKWQKLPILIEIFAESESSLRMTAENYLRSWLSSYNRTHQLQPTKAEIARARGVIEAHGVKLQGRLGHELRAIVASL